MKETIDKAKSDQEFFEYLGESTMIAWIIAKLFDEGVDGKAIKILVKELKVEKTIGEGVSISSFIRKVGDKYNIEDLKDEEMMQPISEELEKDPFCEKFLKEKSESGNEENEEEQNKQMQEDLANIKEDL